MTRELRYKMGEAAIKAASAIHYESVGDGSGRQTPEFLFHEMNTRIQVEHCVTEVVNFDLIKEQIKIAAGSISGVNYEPQGHASNAVSMLKIRYVSGLLRKNYDTTSRAVIASGWIRCICRLYHSTLLRFHDCQNH
jgi:hypothetical protein